MVCVCFFFFTLIMCMNNFTYMPLLQPVADLDASRADLQCPCLGSLLIRKCRI